MPTIFEDIIAKKIPAEIVFEDDDILAFHDIAPQAPIHILVIPKRAPKAKDFSDLCHWEDAAVATLFKKTAALAKQLGLKDYRIISNCGEQAGQTVFYLHLHLLSGRAFAWPPG